MKFFLALILCVIAMASVSQAERVRYDHCQVYRVYFTNDEQFNYLYEMSLNSTKVNFWELVRIRHYADIMVSSVYHDEFLADLRAHDLRYELTIKDVQKLIDAERQ